MFKKYRLIITMFLTFVLLFTNLPVIGGIQKAEAATITISNSSYTLEVGHYKTLSVSGTSNKVTWSSSNTAVASVSTSGRVTAKSAGIATVYASVAGKKLSCKVTVIKISSLSLSLYKGDTKTLKISGTSSTVLWSSSNKLVATVSALGKVTAKAVGTATIYAAVLGKKLDCKITVKEPEVTSTQSSNVQNPPDYNSGNIVTPTPTDQNSNPQAKVIGYYAAWARYSGFSPDKIDAGKLTHINYAFANIGSDLKITLGYPDYDAANISQLNALKITNPNLKTLISVGGWDWSGRFSDAAFSQASRTVFADSCVNFVVKYGFDGVDLDWEYPVNGGLSTNIRRPEDKFNFTLLLQTLREKLDAQGALDGKKYILSFAGAAGSWYLKNIQPDEISKYVDYANIMTYDIHGSWDQTTNFNAPLYTGNDAGFGNISVDSSIQAWLATGFPKDKIVMGVPFYGFIYKSVTNSNNGLYQSYSGAASISYANIAGNYLNSSAYKRYFHSSSLVPWLFNGSTFITYEDEQSMSEKAKYIKENGLSGVMIWELSQDPNHVLLDSLYKGLNQ